MTKHVNTGGPAFPKLRSLNNCKPGEKIATYTSDGMTLRDYFAAKALQGYLANAWQAQELDSMGESAGQQIATVAEISYAMADAMLRAREGVK